MNQCLINAWNYTVTSEEDTVFVIGDFSLSRNREAIENWTKQLKGHKHLILGNHDELKPWHYVHAGFESVHTSYDFYRPPINELCYLIHDPATYNALPKGSKLLCGHVHNTFKRSKDNPNIINVGVDQWQFRPVSLLEIEELYLDE